MEYRDNPNHARSRFIVPTPKALTIRAELEAAGSKLEKILTAELSDKERLQFVTLLQKMPGLTEEQ